ncbi:nuclear receptor-interacting protein 3 [Eublepharis macularius]|uniref:Nuclear receptor-interacting protein 3 n=1 Tax=Eublepharis macularius TaxID=481883 RepID=A0AA97KN00_EUBMA|nr:nuclear receptor-interacting protein 3 [Eublepharis macularius]
MFYSGILTEPTRKDVDMREAASLRQQRRMKQAVQFNHKDSADLLPLDGLKKLGTSKDTQPHNILQRRLMETNMSRLRHNRGSCSQKNDLSAQANKLNQMKLDGPKKTEQEDFIMVCCQCAGKELQVAIDTGCQRNIISSACLERLGLKELVQFYKPEDEKILLSHNMKVIGHIEHLALTIGTILVDCSAVVTEDNEKNFSLGLQTLKSLKCVINMEKHHLVLGKSDREEISFVGNVSSHEEKAHPHGSHLRSWFSSVAHSWKPGKCPWKRQRVPSSGKPSQTFSSICQKATEPYTDFVNRLQEALKRQVDNAAAREELLIRLAKENATSECRRVITGLGKNPELADMIRACQDIGSSSHQAFLLAAALHQGGKPGGKCFNCGNPGHFAAEGQAPGGGGVQPTPISPT